MRNRRGMTLVEVMVLIAILGILAAVILPALMRAGQAAGPPAASGAGAPDDAESAAGSMTLIAISLVALLVVLNIRRTGVTISVKDGKIDFKKRKG